MKTTRILAAAAALAALAGCAGLAPPAPTSDAALCTQARAERLRGDPAWIATVERMRSLYDAWYCVNYLMPWDSGENPGGP